MGSKSPSPYETLFAEMVLGVSRIGSTDSAQQPIYGAVFALARVSRGLIPPAQPHMEPQLRCADCLLSVGGWEGVGGTRKLLPRPGSVLLSKRRPTHHHLLITTPCLLDVAIAVSGET